MQLNGELGSEDDHFEEDDDDEDWSLDRKKKTKKSNEKVAVKRLVHLLLCLRTLLHHFIVNKITKLIKLCLYFNSIEKDHYLELKTLMDLKANEAPLLPSPTRRRRWALWKTVFMMKMIQLICRCHKKFSSFLCIIFLLR